jgi:hypothetical protein
MRKIDSIALEITTACNLRCPQCCCAIGQRPVVHHDAAYFKSLAPFIQGIRRVDITGGEPTAHPLFRELVTSFKRLFNCAELTLETNAFRLREYEDILPLFDMVRLSAYPENEPDVAWALAHCKLAYVQNGSTCAEIDAPGDERRHISQDRRGGGGSCLLGNFEFVLYADGKFWPCRLGPAVDGALGVRPQEGWLEKVLSLPSPCQSCCFSPGEPK